MVRGNGPETMGQPRDQMTKIKGPGGVAVNHEHRPAFALIHIVQFIPVDPGIMGVKGIKVIKTCGGRKLPVDYSCYHSTPKK